jgi:hypothetical protein
MQLAPIFHGWVFILCSIKSQKIHRRQTLVYPLWRHKFKTFGGTIRNVTVTPVTNDGRGPREWSHDASMTACMYPSTMGWPLVTCIMDVTMTWQPLPITFDMYCHPLQWTPKLYSKQKCLDPPIKHNMHANSIKMNVQHVASPQLLQTLLYNTFMTRGLPHKTTMG